MPAEAAEIFAATTEAATVNPSPEDAVKRRERASFLDWPAAGGLPRLTGEVGAAHDPNGSPT
ncbi:type II toxin-antitoxin system VapB family antitoxin [Streptomyces sp. ME03-5709C]|nr:type II toxin-antitoxin system VapB family antitoxin [Streptomyces sp. ME03-5709C]